MSDIGSGGNSTPATTTMGFNTYADNFYGVICLYCFSFGTIGNIMAFVYFIKKPKDVPTIIYNFIVAVDTCISILVLPISVSFFDRGNTWFFKLGNWWFCDIWAFLWTTFQRLSIFLVAMLATTRAYSLVFPFKVVKKRIVLGIIITAFIIHSLGTSIPLWFAIRHVFFTGAAACIKFDHTKLPLAVVRIITMFDWLGVFLPIPIIITCFIITVIQLLRTTAAGGGAGDAGKKNVTITIALFTTIYLMLNIPAAIYILLYGLMSDKVWYIDQAYYGVAFTYVLVVPLNSAINPVIYFWRMDRMREQSISLIRRSFKKARGGIASPEPFRMETHATYVPLATATPREGDVKTEGKV